MTVEALLEKARQALSDARYLQADARADAPQDLAVFMRRWASLQDAEDIGGTPLLINRLLSS